MQHKYICVGTSFGKVLIVIPQKNSFFISQTLETNSQAINAMAGMDNSKTKSSVSISLWQGIQFLENTSSEFTKYLKFKDFASRFKWVNFRTKKFNLEFKMYLK